MATTSVAECRAVLIAWLVSSSACGGSAARSAGEAPSTVGMRTLDLLDPGRSAWSHDGPRPLRTSLWYPAAANAAVESILEPDLPFLVDSVAPNATLAASPGRYPLVLVSHGTGGSALQMMWLGTHLARHGYLVAAVNHHGNSGAVPPLDPRGFLLYWERAQDVSAVLDRLLADPTVGPRIDTTRIGAAGFSLGGYTVLSVAGARFNQQVYDAFCASDERDFTCGPQPEFPQAPALFEALRQSDSGTRASLSRGGDSYRDPRVRAVFAIAPALGAGFTGPDLRDVTVPVSIVVGAGDSITPPRTNAVRYANQIPGATLTILEGAVGHYTFLLPCSDRGRAVVPVCRDGDGVDRAAVHDSVRALALRFFDRTLVRQ